MGTPNTRLTKRVDSDRRRCYSINIMQRADASWERDRRSAFKTEVSEFVAVEDLRGGSYMTQKETPPTNQKCLTGRTKDRIVVYIN